MKIMILLVQGTNPTLSSNKMVTKFLSLLQDGLLEGCAVPYLFNQQVKVGSLSVCLLLGYFRQIEYLLAEIKHRPGFYCQWSGVASLSPKSLPWGIISCHIDNMYSCSLP